MPETRVSSGAEAVLTSTPTAFTQSSTTASSERDSLCSAEVVLVLADADRLRVDLHQLGERDPAAAARSTPRRAATTSSPGSSSEA